MQVSNLSSVTLIGAGSNHSLAARSDGSVWAWGQNNDGQLGNNSTVDSHVPVQVSGLSGVASLSGGDTHSLALRADGTVWAWGHNGYGQLGTNSFNDSWVPVQSSGISGVSLAPGSGQHSLALKADGTVWGWGDNSYGQFGNDSTSYTLLPVESDMSGVAIAGSHPGSTAGVASRVYTYFSDSQTDLSGNVSAGGWLQAVSDPLGHFVAYGYDQAGHQVRSWERNATSGKSISAFPGSVSSPPSSQYSETLYGSGASAYAHPWRYVLSRRDPAGNVSSTTVDGNGNPLSVTKPNGGVTSKHFEARDLVTFLQQSAPGDGATTSTYDRYGNLSSQTDGNGAVTTYAYDAVNRKISTTFTRGPWPSDTSTVPPSCRQSNSGDAPIPAGRILCSTQTTYDQVDDKTAVSDGNGQVTTYAYDALHHQTQMVSPRSVNGRNDTSQTVYDRDGNVLLSCPPRQFSESSVSCAVPASDPCSSACPAFSTLHAYDALDRLVSTATWRQTAPGSSSFNENKSSFSYDPDGNKVSSSDANGHSTSYGFDLLDQLTFQSLPRAGGVFETTQYGYDASGNRTSVLDPAGRITLTTYDADNRVIDSISGASSLNPAAVGTPDSAGGSNIRTRNLYDADGNRVAVYEPRAFASSVSSPDASYVTNYVFDVDDRPVALAVPRYDSSAHSDPLSRSQDAECPSGVSSVSVPGQAARALAVVPPSSVGVCLTAVDYDPAGNRAHLYTPAKLAGSDANRYLTYSYSDDHLVASLDSPNPAGSGRVQSTFLYDGDAKQVLAKDPLGEQQATQYTADELLSVSTDALSHATTYSYDANGNQNSVADATGVSTATAFYSDNQKEFVTQGSQDGTGDAQTGAVKGTTAYQYDAAGNATAVWTPSGWAAHSGSSYKDANNSAGAATSNTYSSDNLLLATSQPLKPDGSVRRQTSYQYDGSGLKVSQHSFETDASGHPLSGQEGGSQTFAYYPDSRLHDEANSQGQVLTTQYDAAGNRTSVSDSNGPTLSATYYLDSLTRSVSDGIQTTSYAYDGAGQLSARQDSGQGLTAYTYSSAELLASAAESPFSQSFSYDAAGRLTQESSNAGTVTLGYNANDTLAYDTLSSGGNTLTNWTYQYDAAHRITEQQFTGQGAGGATPNQSTLCFAYDARGRLGTAYTAATGSHCGAAPAANIGWDHNSNRLSYAGPLTTATATFTYNADNSIATEQDGSSPVRTYTETAFGGVSADGCATYSFDGFSRMTSMTASGCGLSSATYTYDALDRMHTSSAGSATQTFHYDGWNTTATTVVPSSGSTTTYEVSPADQPLGVTQGSTNQNLFSDGHGNVSTAVTTSGSVACTARFDPFGNPLNVAGTVTPGTQQPDCNTGSTPNTFFYRNARHDSSSGDYPLGSRLYDPQKSSYLTQDNYRRAQPARNPNAGMDPVVLNTYTYVNGDPVNLSDPSGHRYTTGCEDSASDAKPCYGAGPPPVMPCSASGSCTSSGGAGFYDNGYHPQANPKAGAPYDYHNDSGLTDQQASTLDYMELNGIDPTAIQSSYWSMYAANLENATFCADRAHREWNALCGDAGVPAPADLEHPGIALLSVAGTAVCSTATAGAGLVGCLSAVGAVTGGVQGTIDCPAGQNRAACAATGAAVGAGIGAASGGASILGKAILSRVASALGQPAPATVLPQPEEALGAAEGGGGASDIFVIGKQVDTDAYIGKPGFNVLNFPKEEWSIANNDAWVQGGMDRGAPFMLASEPNPSTVFNPSRGELSVFGRELRQLFNGGYDIQGAQQGELLWPGQNWTAASGQ